MRFSRMTTRRWMIVVAVAAGLLAATDVLLRRRSRLHERSQHHWAEGYGTDWQEAANRPNSTGQLIQIGVALASHANAHGSYPAAYTTDPQGNPLLSWRVSLLPVWGNGNQTRLFASIDPRFPWDHPNNALAARADMPADFWWCESDGGRATN